MVVRCSTNWANRWFIRLYIHSFVRIGVRAASYENYVILEQHAPDSGDDTGKKTLQNNAVSVISKTCNKKFLLFMNICVIRRPTGSLRAVKWFLKRVCTLSNAVDSAVLSVVKCTICICCWSEVSLAHRRRLLVISRDSGLSFPFRPFLLGFKGCKLLSPTFALQKRTWTEMIWVTWGFPLATSRLNAYCGNPR